MKKQILLMIAILLVLIIGILFFYQGKREALLVKQRTEVK
jgi:hypothetical protein